MYKIKGDDEKDLGPFTALVIRQWVSAGRADEQTLLLKVGENEWKPLGHFPEFAALSGGGRSEGQPPHPPAGASHGVPAPVTATRSRLAIISVILGILGAAGITALAGLVTGLLALKQIARSGGRLQGTALAVTGTVLSGAMLLLVVPAVSGLVIVPLMQARQQAAEATCLDHVRRLNLALKTYAQNHGGAWPEAGSWCDQLATARLITRGDDVLQCPSEQGVACGYAFNETLSGLGPDLVSPDTVLLFESNLGWNGHGSVEDMADSRHGMYVIIGFAGGSVEKVPAWQIPQLRWLPATEP